MWGRSMPEPQGNLFLEQELYLSCSIMSRRAGAEQGGKVSCAGLPGHR